MDMPETGLSPTPLPDVNVVLHDFAARIRAILGNHFLGMYLYGSLALGDFDPGGSDIDFLVVTDADLPDELFMALHALHAQFHASDSPWAGRIEAAYIPQGALRHAAPTPERYPQLEKGRTLVRIPLESGWAFQAYTLREHGVAVAGPAPHTWIEPVAPGAMRAAVIAIAGEWQDRARHDPAWLVWLGEGQAQAFVVLTLCRLLYSLDTGAVASKPVAARHAQETLGTGRAGLIERALAGQRDKGKAPQADVNDTLALIDYVVERALAP